MVQPWCVILILAIAAAGCRRAAENSAPTETANIAPAADDRTASEREHINSRPVGAWKLPMAWREFSAAYPRDAVAVVKTQGRAITAAVFAAAENAARDPVALIRAGDRALAAGRGKRALELFGRAAEMEPDNADALIGQSLAMVSIRRYEQALPVYVKLLELADARDAGTIDIEAVRFNYAVALSLSGRLERARTQYETLLDADAGNFRARFNLATLLHAQNHLTDAAKHYRVLLDDAKRLAPADAAAAWASYGQLLVDLHDDEAAFTAFAEAAKAQPDDAVGWLNLAAAAQAVGRYGTAVTSCKRAATLDPQDPAAWQRLAELYRELHQATKDPAHLKEAQACEETSRKLDPVTRDDE